MSLFTLAQNTKHPLITDYEKESREKKSINNKEGRHKIPGETNCTPEHQGNKIMCYR